MSSINEAKQKNTDFRMIPEILGCSRFQQLKKRYDERNHSTFIISHEFRTLHKFPKSFLLLAEEDVIAFFNNPAVLYQMTIPNAFLNKFGELVIDFTREMTKVGERIYQLLDDKVLYNPSKAHDLKNSYLSKMYKVKFQSDINTLREFFNNFLEFFKQSLEICILELDDILNRMRFDSIVIEDERNVELFLDEIEELILYACYCGVKTVVFYQKGPEKLRELRERLNFSSMISRN